MTRNIKEGDKVEYAPYHQAVNPKTAKAHTTGEVTSVNHKPTKADPNHKTYTILNDNTGKETTYGARSITENMGPAEELEQDE
ncbi:hypothetical protein SCHPADRAFT_942496 [Schizopora paradoxa]|uniref:Hypervirulence associated protein TUDOR domain-containing protein n=1 Tax=Schizopora paradoxa TaxID=27342 RepID=A0A0H2RN64_9AGAM|nr:hypothetical protein SCHPADRAFT_942496 [Schizopora paradoxa]